MSVKVFGHTVSTPAAVAIAGGSGVAIWFAYKQHKDSQASSGASNPSAIDPVTGLPYSEDNTVDPLTGETYLAEAQQYGSVSAAEQAAAGESADDLSNASDSGLSDLSGSGTGSTSLEAVPGGYATNAAWAQAVTAGLSDIGYSSTDVAAALGMYLGGLPLSTLADGVSSASIVSAAIAEYGPPPVGTFTMIAASPTTTASAGSTSTGSTTTTSTGGGAASSGSTSTGSTSTAAAPNGTFALPTARSDTPYSTFVDLGWSAVPGAQKYHYQVLLAAGTVSVADAETTATSVRVTGLKPGTQYEWRMAVDATSTMNSSPWSPTVHFFTTS